MTDILHFIDIFHLIKIYEIYTIIRDWIIYLITSIICYFVSKNNDQLMSIIFKSNNYQVYLPLDLNLENINEKLNHNDQGYLEIKYIENNQEYIQLVPWNQQMNNNFDVELVSQNTLFIKMLSPVEIVFAIDNQGNDLTDIVNKYSPHLNEHCNCPTKMFNNYMYKDIKLEHVKQLIPELNNKKIEILTENGLTIHI